MKPILKTAKKTANPPRGFALIVTLSLLILLTVIAVGLLSLSSISLRAAGRASDQSIARANARLALMLAIGELQKQTGLDTRVTARADILAKTNPPILGAWKSWEGTDHETSGPFAGRPVSPGSDYNSVKARRFLRWLVSGDPAALSNSANLPSTTKSASSVALVGENSVGPAKPELQIHLTPTVLTGGTQKGSFAWWVGGENQKARIPRPYAPKVSDEATWSVLAKTHSVADTQPFGLDKLLTDPSLNDPAALAPGTKAITLKESDLLGTASKVSQDFFHDLSTTSVGLLTNTATGGWRKDLSLVTETWDNSTFPNTALPFFRATPTQDLLFTRPTSTDPTAPKSLPYYWSDYRRGDLGGLAPIYGFPPISSWNHLVRYATLYKDFSPVASNKAVGTDAKGFSIGGGAGGVFDFMHRVRILPVIARVQWIFSHKAKQSPAPAPAGTYDLFLVVAPIVTLWNPYSVRLSVPDNLDISIHGTLPPVITYKVNGAPLPKKIFLQEENTRMDLTTSKGAYQGSATYSLVKGTVPPFAPGETRLFSPGILNYTLTPGYNPLGGQEYLIASALNGTSKISTSMTFDAQYDDAGATGVGMYMDMGMGPAAVLAYRMLYETTFAASTYPQLDESKFPSPSLAAVVIPTPFLSVTFGARMASNTHLPSKGFVQSSPFVNYTAMGLKGTQEPTIRYIYPGVLHNVNSPFEYSFQGLKTNSPYLPEVDASNHGFIVTGYKAADGLSRCVIDELPGRPLNSLPELQNWDARYENPIPPYSFNLVGNSDASPILPANAVVAAAEVSAKGAENLQNDDSYCLNHVLFDDWFFSSIAPEPAGFGNPPSTSTPMSTYSNFLRDPSKPLANRAYKALAQDVSLASQSAASADALAAKNVDVVDTSWKTIASRLEVEGMFNVNSTSVKAWRALLGHARNLKVPYMGGTGNPQLSPDTDYAFSRFSVAGDVETKQFGSSGKFPKNAEYEGYRVFTPGQLDFLAEEIVNQVRLRGPFLSLSEFVNRQLSSGDPALAGAIQTALNKLTLNALNPFGQLQKDLTPDVLGTNIATANPPGGDSGYKFPEAAKGYNIYGLPGWTRQADILRPIAPILSARDDTFTIRAYGDARDSTGTIIRARAFCEATIRRTREYIDPSDDAALIGLSDSSGNVTALKTANKNFGRRFEILSFRWLSKNEI